MPTSVPVYPLARVENPMQVHPVWLFMYPSSVAKEHARQRGCVNEGEDTWNVEVE